MKSRHHRAPVPARSAGGSVGGSDGTRRPGGAVRPGRRPTRTATARPTTHGEQGLAHARRRRADRGLLPRPRHAERARRCSSWSPTARRSPSARATPRAARVELADPRSLTYRQVTRAARPLPHHQDLRRPTRPRDVLLVDVRFESLTGQARTALRAATTRRLGNDGDDDSGATRGRRAAGERRRQPGGERADRRARASPRTSSGYLGTPATAGRTSRRLPHGLGLRRRAPTGNVVQTAETALTGVRRRAGS